MVLPDSPAILLLTSFLFLGAPLLCQEDFHQRQELYIETSGESTYHAVVDYGQTRWFFAQKAALLPPRKPTSPFTELRPAGGPLRSADELLRLGETTLGFSSPWLWFGPVRLQGALAAMERPLLQGAFSGAWGMATGTSLAAGREPPSRLGVGAEIGPVSFHHFRTKGLTRSAVILSAGENGERGLWGELLVSHEEPVAGDLLPEPWFLGEPPLMAREGSHGALRAGFNGGRLEQRLLLAASATTLDLPGFAAVSATTLVRRPWGWSLALVGPNYRDGGLELLAPGISSSLRRKPSARRGHTLGASLTGRRTGSTGAGEGGELESGVGVRWKWRPSKSTRVEPRWEMTAETSREASLPRGEKGWNVRVATLPQLRRRRQRHGDGRWEQRIAVPLGWELELLEEEKSRRSLSVGLEGQAKAGDVTLGGGWNVEFAMGEEPTHAPELSVTLSWGELRRWQLRLRLGTAGTVSLGQLETINMEDGELEGVLYLRVLR